MTCGLNTKEERQARGNRKITKIGPKASQEKHRETKLHKGIDELEKENILPHEKDESERGRPAPTPLGRETNLNTMVEQCKKKRAEGEPALTTPTLLREKRRKGEGLLSLA